MSQDTSASPNLLRQERLRRGWSQLELADRLGTTVLTVKRWERGTQRPSAYFRVKLCSLFGKSEEELGLFKGKESPEQTLAATREHEQDLLVSVPSKARASRAEASEEEKNCENDQLEEKKMPESTSMLPAPLGTPSGRPSVFSRALSFTSRSPRNRVVLLSILLLLCLGASTVFFVHLSFPFSGSPSQTGPSLSPSEPPQTPLPTNDPVGVAGLVGTLTLDDPLAQPSQQSNWQTGDECRFQDKAYHVRFVGIEYCSANNPSFRDFAYQIEVELQQGSQAGIIFRADADSHLYYFSVDVQGRYALDLVNPPLTPGTLLSGNSRALIWGYNHFNVLTVVAQEGDISLWINHQQVGEVHNVTFDQGHIGVAAGSYYDKEQSTITVALFRHAKVWEHLYVP